MGLSDVYGLNKWRLGQTIMDEILIPPAAGPVDAADRLGRPRTSARPFLLADGSDGARPDARPGPLACPATRACVGALASSRVGAASCPSAGAAGDMPPLASVVTAPASACGESGLVGSD